MSNHLAVATVTAALNELLSTTVDKEVSGAKVSMVRPDGLTKLDTDFGVNLFLYQVAPNGAYRNADLPTRRRDSSVVEKPQIALVLHYLLTFYGNETNLEPQRLLGSVVRRLHSRPLLTRELIRDTVKTNNNLKGSDLAEQIELVKFTPLSLSLEDLSKLWSMFFEIPYRLSVAYLGTVVLIEADETPERPLPVRQRNVYAVPFRQPVIERITSKESDGEIITVDSILAIEGKHLRGNVTRLRIGTEEVIPEAKHVTDTRIDLGLASPVAPKNIPPKDFLRAGLQGVQIVHRLLMGTPETEHGGVESNVMPLLLRPTIKKKVGPSGQPLDKYAIAVTPASIAPGNKTIPAKLEIKLEPKVDKAQRVILLLNEFADKAPKAFSFAAETRSTDSDTVNFSLRRVEAGNYLVRVQVDGSQSPLEVDTNKGSSTYNRYYRPRVNIP
jgi:hypothetical protein